MRTSLNVVSFAGPSPVASAPLVGSPAALRATMMTSDDSRFESRRIRRAALGSESHRSWVLESGADRGSELGCPFVLKVLAVRDLEPGSR